MRKDASNRPNKERKEMMSWTLILILNSLVYGQDSPIRSCSVTRRDLVANGCSIGCVTVTRNSFPCPICMDGCENVRDECSPMNATSCPGNYTCLASGVAGRYTCVNHLREGQVCNFNLDSSVTKGPIRLPAGIQARESLGSAVSNSMIPCLRGLVCRRESLTRSVCREEGMLQGPCSRARVNNTELRCNEEGNYEPLQCSLISSRRMYRCRCVNASGMTVPNSEQDVASPRDGPDCVDMVQQRCRYQSSLGFFYEVRSGMPFLNVNCSRCLCRDGVATLCDQTPAAVDACRTINPEPTRERNCMLRGQTVQNNQSITVGCNRCRCLNGRLACTRRACVDDAENSEDDDEEIDPVHIGDNPMDSDEERMCRMCAMMRAQPVCGHDGRTYISQCYARNCRGLNTTSIRPGRCSGNDVCDQFPCGDGQVCSRAGGVTCLSRAGCHPDRLRKCVNLTTLTCRNREDSPESTADENSDEDMVCGNDGRTYTGVCNLLQNAAGIRVAYAGRCNQTECRGSQVCGTDNETYSNICELQANSANARVDYRGACMDTGTVVNQRCRQLRNSGRCANLTGCTSLVRPEDGCCPVCGGAITIGIDREGLDEYVRLNPSLETLDDFVTTLITDSFIPQRILNSCRISANLLDTGDLHMVLENMMVSDSTCRMFTETMANDINNPPRNNNGSMSTTAVPQVLQFATVAQAAQLVESSTTTGAPQSGGVKIASYITLALVGLLPAILLS